MKCRRLSFLTVILGIVVCAASMEIGQAQVSATISGRVQDASGAAVSGAIVTIRNLETGSSRSITADDAGNFRAVSLSLGRQEVRAEKTGFKAAIRSGIHLEVGQEAV